MNSPQEAAPAFDVAIVGGGIAGAAALFHLTRRGLRCVLLEREQLAGMHATGRNAAMIRQNVVDPVERALAQHSAAFYADPREFLDPLVFRRTGSLLLFSERPRRHEVLPDGPELPLVREELSVAEACARVPLLEGASFGAAEYCPSDGVIDAAGLLQNYLRAALAAGAEFWRNAELLAVQKTHYGFDLQTRAGALGANALVDAAGAWSGVVATLLGATSVPPLHCFRRHLYVTAPRPSVHPDWPFVWHEDLGFYVRPESGGLLFCPCDETLMDAAPPPVDPQVEEFALQKCASYLPALAEIVFRYRWAGLRTFSPSQRAWVGADPHIAGLFWCAALGGHGISTAHEVGRLLAAAIAGPESAADEPLLQLLAPSERRSFVSHLQSS